MCLTPSSSVLRRDNSFSDPWPTLQGAPLICPAAVRWWSVVVARSVAACSRRPRDQMKVTHMSHRFLFCWLQRQLTRAALSRKHAGFTAPCWMSRTQFSSAVVKTNNACTELAHRSSKKEQLHLSRTKRQSLLVCHGSAELIAKISLHRFAPKVTNGLLRSQKVSNERWLIKSMAN